MVEREAYSIPSKVVRVQVRALCYASESLLLEADGIAEEDRLGGELYDDTRASETRNTITYVLKSVTFTVYTSTSR